MEKNLTWYLVTSLVLQILAIIMLILKTNYMLSRFGSQYPTIIMTNENVFLYIAIGILVVSNVLTGFGLYHSRKRGCQNNYSDMITGNRQTETML